MIFDLVFGESATLAAPLVALAAATLVPCTPVTFTLEKDFEAGLLAHSYLAVILFWPGLIVVYFDESTKFHFE